MLFTKARLASLVVLSSVLGYLFAPGPDLAEEIIWLCIGGGLVTASSNGLNQIIERKKDFLMKRTQTRPLPAGRMSVAEAVLICVVAGSAGTVILYLYTGIIPAILGLASMISYAFIYTPLKGITSWSVFVGAFPGAMPPMLGYIAKSGEFGFEPGLLFFVQFMWQFPHFWAIAWVAADDYAKAGYHLLPSAEGRGKKSSYLIMIYTLLLIPVSASPWLFDLTGVFSVVAAAIIGLLFYLQSVKLHVRQTMKDAKLLMFYSFAYLPVIQLVYVLDKLK